MATDIKALQVLFEYLRTVDVRLLAAAGATLLLIAGVMWVVPTTPNSNSFTFDTTRRGISDARSIELAKPIRGALVDGSDADFYRISPLQSSYRLDIRLTNNSTTLIPALRIFDATKTLVQEKGVSLREPGASLESSFKAQSNMTYYVQVLGQANTTGPYVLLVTVHQP
jgi:hypothetical protein